MEITVRVPDNIYQHIEQLAEITERSIADTISSMMSVALSPLDSTTPVQQLSDHQVLEIANSQMNEVQNMRMSELLDKQQTGTIDDGEKAELAVFLYVYQQGNLRKAQAMTEGVRRGIIELREK